MSEVGIRHSASNADVIDGGHGYVGTSTVSHTKCVCRSLHGIMYFFETGAMFYLAQLRRECQNREGEISTISISNIAVKQVLLFVQLNVASDSSRLGSQTGYLNTPQL